MQSRIGREGRLQQVNSGRALNTKPRQTRATLTLTGSCSDSDAFGRDFDCLQHTSISDVALPGPGEARPTDQTKMGKGGRAGKGGEGTRERPPGYQKIN